MNSSPLAIRLHQDAVNETYSDLEKMLFKITHKFSRRFNIHFDIIFPETQRAFVNAYRAYNTGHRKKATFVTFCYFCINKDLSTWLDKRIKESKRTSGHVELNEEVVGGYMHNTTFRLDLEAELSEDARHVVHLVLDSPSDMVATLRMNRAKSPTDVLRSVKEHLADIGWSAARIKESVSEIAGLLK